MQSPIPPNASDDVKMTPDAQPHEVTETIIGIPLEMFDELYAALLTNPQYEVRYVLPILRIHIGTLALLEKVYQINDIRYMPNKKRVAEAIKKIKFNIEKMETIVRDSLKTWILPDDMTHHVHTRFKSVKADKYDNVKKKVDAIYRKDKTFSALVDVEPALYPIAYLTVAVNTLPTDDKKREDVFRYNPLCREDVTDYYDTFKMYYAERFNDTFYELALDIGAG